MNFGIRKKLCRAATIALISLVVTPAVLAEVDDSNVNNPNGNTITNSSDAYAVELDNGASFTVVNNGTISALANTDPVGVGLEDSSTITNLNNSGTISAVASEGEAYSIYTFSSTITNLNNIGTISGEAGNDDGYGIYNTTTTITNLNNIGTISGEAGNDDSYGIYNDRSNITNLTNSGTIKAVAADDGAYAIYNDGATITNLTNTGTISAEVTDVNAYGIYNDGATITNLTNTGTISAKAGGDVGDWAYGIYNDDATITNLTNTGIISGTTKDVGAGVASHIVNFNNLQSGLTYEGRLPRNYSTIIQGNNYGQLFVAASPTESSTGDTVYTPFAGGADVGVHIPSGTYTSVMTGMPDANLHSTVSGTLTGDGVNSVGTVNWQLNEVCAGMECSNTWDLTISGGTYTYIGKNNTQKAINQTAHNVGDVFKNLSAAGNFANTTAYDPNFFNGKDNFISIGGRTTKAGGTDTAAVVVAGKKLNDHVRIGGYIDQTINHGGYKDIDVDSKIPLMGMMGVWNKSADQLGLQIKLANSYQSNDVTITRAAVGSSELAKGDTDIKSQSYIVEASYLIYDAERNVTFKSFGALRYMKIELEGYKEKGVNLPITYQDSKDENFAAIVGVEAYHKISPKITLNGSLGLECDINDNEANLKGDIDGISAFNSASIGNDKNDTRALASVGAHVHLDFGGRVEVKGMYQELRYNKDEATTAYVTYTLPF